jgi:hypothetical protein
MIGKFNQEDRPCRRDDASRAGKSGRLRRIAIMAMAAAFGIVAATTFGPAEQRSAAEVSSSRGSGNAVAFDLPASLLIFAPATLPQSFGDPGRHPSELPAAGRVILAAAETEQKQNEKLDDWREEGLRMASELTGIPEAFFRWLQDKGVPVGEFMRFLMPFLEWIEMVDPHNGTKPSAPPKSQPRQTTV